MLMVMDPMQQQPAPQNPYGFIVDPQQPQKRPFLSGNSTQSRMLIVGGAVLLLIIIGVAVSTIFSSINNRGTNQLKTVYAEQQEVIRIAEMGAREARSSDTRNFAITTQFAVQTSQTEIDTLLKTRKAKLKPEEINIKKNDKLETLLTSAAANNRYDETIHELLQKQITSYSQALQAAYEGNKGQQTRSTLTEAFQSATLLIKPAESAQ